MSNLVFKTNFKDVEKSVMQTLPEGIFLTKINKVERVDSKTEKKSVGIRIIVKAAESEGKYVGFSSSTVLWVSNKEYEGELTDHGKKRVKEVMDAIGIDYDPVLEFNFDAKNWEGKFVYVQTGIEKSHGVQEDGTPYPDRIAIKWFLTEENAEYRKKRLESKDQMQKPIATGGENDILDKKQYEEFNKKDDVVKKQEESIEQKVDNAFEEEETTFEEETVEEFSLIDNAFKDLV